MVITAEVTDMLILRVGLSKAGLLTKLQVSYTELHLYIDLCKLASFLGKNSYRALVRHTPLWAVSQ